MLVLVVDSSTPAVTAALADVGADGVLLRAERVTVDARAHGELLAPQVDAVLA
ncbi:tRNA (adenosine(37)-N6)-threonylcarbamoyltransferase complex dimerization subunit type 1 TsaB, partial [Micromonospora zhanjiangensis]